MVEVNTESLRGRIEKVYIEGAIRDDLAHGILNGTSVIVSNVGSYVKQECLVRFDASTNTRPGRPIGNFITSHVPEDFRGLSPKEYVLCGLWTYEMSQRQRDNFPSMDEFFEYYSPGNARVMFYIDYSVASRLGQAIITQRNCNRRKFTVTSLFKQEFPKLGNSSRIVVVAPGHKGLERLVSSVKANNAVPILMEAMTTSSPQP